MDFIPSDPSENQFEGAEEQGHLPYVPSTIGERLGDPADIATHELLPLWRQAQISERTDPNARLMEEGSNFGLPADTTPVEKALPVKELQARHPEAKEAFTQPLPPSLVDDVVGDWRRKQKLENAQARAPGGVGTALLDFGAGTVANFLDPVADAAFMVPVIGEARYAGWLARAGENAGWMGRAGVTAGVGAVRGGAGGAIISGIQYAQDPDTTLGDAATETAEIALQGGVLHSATAFRGDILGQRFVHEAIDEYAKTHDAAFRTAAAQMADWRRVEVRPLYGLRALKDPLYRPRLSTRYKGDTALGSDVVLPPGVYEGAGAPEAKEAPQGRRAPTPAQAPTPEAAKAQKADLLDNAIAEANGAPSQDETRLRDEAAKAKASKPEELLDSEIEEGKADIERMREKGELDAEDEAEIRAAEEAAAGIVSRKQPSRTDGVEKPENTMPLRQGARESGPSVLSGMSSRLHEELAQNPSADRRTEIERQLQELRERLPAAGKIGAADVPSLRGEGAEASSGLQPAASRGVAVPTSPHESASPRPVAGTPTGPPPEKERPAGYGSGNKLVDTDAYERAKARMANRARTQLNAGLDPEMIQDGLTMAVFHLEAGARAFHDYAKAMVGDLGEWVRPYLKSFYESARHYPGFDAEGMTPAEHITPEFVARAGLEQEPAGNRARVPTPSPAPPAAKPGKFGAAMKENAAKNGVEIKFASKPDMATLGRLKSAGYRWSKFQKLWYAKRSERALGLARELSGETPGGKPIEQIRNPTERIEAQADAEAAHGEINAAENQPGSMPPPDVLQPPPAPRFMIGDNVRLTPKSPLFGREQEFRKIVGLTPDGMYATLDGGTAVPVDTLERLEDELPQPLPAGTPGEEPQTVQGASEGGQNGRLPQGQNEGGVRTQGADAGGRGQGQTRPADRPAIGTPGGGAGDGTDARLPTAGERAEPGAPKGSADKRVRGTNYSIAPGSIEEERGPKQKARDNLRAIELAKQIAKERRQATHEEQGELAKYVGWGGLSGAFENSRGLYGSGFEDIGERLKKLLTDEEYATAARSTQYAHYTSEDVIRGMWDAVEAMGFRGGSIFEPGMGIGHFIGMMKPEIAGKSHYEGVEMDGVTALIAKALYPKAGVRHGDFTQIPVPENAFDLVIGNPPFSDTVIKADAKYAARNFMLHDYFFAKSIDSVRPGGLLGFVTSAGTMNKLDTAAREYLAQRAEFLGGVRLPSTAFKKNAGTEVTADILFFKKRDTAITKEDAAAQPWLETTARTLPGPEGGTMEGNVSRYFSEHSEQVLGEEGFFDKLYRGRYGVHARPGDELAPLLRDALERLPRDVMTEPPTPEEQAALDFAAPEKKDGSFYLSDDGRLMQYTGGAGREIAGRGKGVKGGMVAGDRDRIEHLIPMRDALRAVYAADLAENEAAGEQARADLNKHYDAFVKKFGPVNKAEYQYRRPSIIQEEYARAEARENARDRGAFWREGTVDAAELQAHGKSLSEIARLRREAKERLGGRFDTGSFDAGELPDVVSEKHPNIDPFMDDPESYRLRAIEDYNEVTGEHGKRRIFFESILRRETEPELRSAGDGVLWSYNKFGRFDLDAIGKKMARSPDDLVKELGDAVFRDPVSGNWTPADEYLSGDIVDKMDQARTRAADDPDYARNVAALEAAMPEPRPPDRIAMRVGMPWIPANIFEDFAREAGVGNFRLAHSPALGGWVLEKEGDVRGLKIRDTGQGEEWGTPDLEARDVFLAAMNRQWPRISKWEGSGEDRRLVFDPVGTQAVADKIIALAGDGKNIPGRFSEWLDSTGRRKELADIYNQNINRTTPRKFDGAYLTTPGVAADWQWRPHQRRVVARIVQTGTTYVAHAVGGGKTSEMIGAGMEMRRLGLVKKPMYVVPNHMLGQFTREFYMQYPTAKIMVADDRRFHTSRRKQFIANAAMSDLDGIIITHSAHEMIPTSHETQTKLIHDALDNLEEALSGLDKQADRITIKKLENQKEKLEQKLKAAFESRKDQTFTFEQMGVDFLFVDEAQKFRKLDFASRQQIKGIDGDGSNRAWDLYSKVRYLDDRNPGRAAVFASGTPITNTMGELYSISRYLQPQALEKLGISHFDAWSSMFGDTAAEVEQTAQGTYEKVTRFARFVNAYDLYKLVAEIMDVVTPGQLDEFVVRPKLKTGQRILHMAPRTDFLDEFQQGLVRRVEAIKQRKGPPKKGDDILLSVIGDGRLGAIDPRLINAGYPPTDSKLTRLIDNVWNIYQRTHNVDFYDPKDNYQTKLFSGPATQMIFSNLGVNERGKNDFTTYKAIKRELIRRGMPAKEIAFIRDFKKNPTQTQKLFNDVNDGKVRVIIGSTEQMGTGTNAQRRLIALHNLDPLWYPADDEQRVGRALRQGNLNPEIEVHDYTTKGTYDSTMWKLMAKKARFIEQFFRGDPELDTIEDLGEASMYDQVSAISTADERVIRLTEMQDDLEREQRRAYAHEREQYSYHVNLRRAEDKANWSRDAVQKTKADIAARDAYRAQENAPKFMIAAQPFDKMGEAAEAVDGEIKGLLTLKGAARKIVGKVGPFDLELNKSGVHVGAELKGVPGGAGAYHLEGESAAGLLRSAQYRIDNLEDRVAGHEKSIAEGEAEAARLRPLVGGKYDYTKINTLRRDIHDLELALAPPEAKPGEKPEAKAEEPQLPTIQEQINANADAYKRGDISYETFDAEARRLHDLKARGAQHEMPAPQGWDYADTGPPYHVDEFMGAPKTGRMIAEGYRLGSVLRHIEIAAKDPGFRELAGRLRDVLDRFGNTVLEPMQEGDRFNENAVPRIGLYDPNHDRISIFPPAAYSPDQVLLHEGVHAATSHAIYYMTPAGRDIGNLYLAYLNLAGTRLPDAYGLTNEHEFVAEFFSNPIFRAQLDTLQAQQDSPSLFARIMDAIKRILGLDTKASNLETILDLQPKLEDPEFLSRAAEQGHSHADIDASMGAHAMIAPSDAPYQDDEKAREIAAKKRLATTYKDARKRKALLADVGSGHEGGLSIPEAIDRETRGINKAVDRARDSTAQKQLKRGADFTSRLMGSLDRLNGGVTAWRQGTLTDDWVRELFQLNSEDGKPGVTGNKLALGIAQAVHDAQRLAKYHLNRTGAWIGDYDGYIARTAHNAVQIHKAGYPAWRDFVLARLDQDRTFAGIMADEDLEGTPEERADDYLKGVWDALSTGVHISSGGGVGFRAGAFPPGFNLGKKLSHERVLHWKDADAWREYQEKFGNPSIENAVMGSLRRAGADVELMDRWGSNPQNTFEWLLRKLATKYRGNHAAIEEFHKRESRLREEFAYLTGEALRTPVVLSARIGALARMWENISKLNLVMFTHFSVGATKPFQLKYAGMGRWQAYTSVLRNLVRDKSPEGRQTLENLGANASGQMAHMLQGFEGQTIPGTVANLQMIAMRLGGLPWLLDRQKVGTQWELANFLGQNVAKTYADLKPQTQRILKIYGIHDGEWNALRLAPDHDRDIHGLTYLTPAAAQRAPDQTIATLAGDRYRMAKAKDRPRILAETRDRLGMKLAAFYADAADRSVVTPGIPERAMFSRAAGRVGGPLIGQYKTWATAAARQMWGQALEGSSKAEAVKSLAELVAVGTAIGYGIGAIKDAIKGREPDFFNGDWRHDGMLTMRSMLQGGGLGIFGDYILGEFTRNSGSKGKDAAMSLLEAAAGPVLSDVAQAGAIAKDWISTPFRDDPEKAFDQAKGETLRYFLDHVPLLNTFWIRTIANWLILDRLQDMAQPGYLARYQANVKARTGQDFWLPPTQYAGAPNQQRQ